MPAAKSIEWNAEELVRRKLLRNATLAAKDIRHWERLATAVLDAIVLRGTKQDVSLEGVQGYNINVDVIFETSTMSEADGDAQAATISSEMYKNDPGFSPVLTDINFCSLEPDTNTERSLNKKLRKWVITFPLILKLID